MKGNISNEARKFSEYLSRVSKQVDEEGKVQWYLAGSLATMTLSGAESIEDVVLDDEATIIGYDGIKKLNNEDRERILLFERKMGRDIDIVNVNGNCFGGAKESERPYTQNIEKNGIVIDTFLSINQIASMSYDALDEEREIKNHNIVKVKTVNGNIVYMVAPADQIAFKMKETIFYQEKLKDENVSEKTINKYNKDIGDLTAMIYAFSNIYTAEELSKKVFSTLKENGVLENENFRELLANILSSIEKRAEELEIPQEDVKKMQEIIGSLTSERINIKNVIAENCPADAVREYIEQIIAKQREYISQGKEVPKELLIPQEIILSPMNIEFLINSKFVDYIGAGETGNEIQFYWKKTDELPALELRAERREDGKFILSYIKEEATEEREEFIWDKNTEEGKKGAIVVSKIQDALEDIYDMDR